MVEGGPIDVLTGDWLAELTMLILSRIRAKQPGGGFARTFVGQMEQVMGTCLDRGIKVVSNAGGLDPGGCADAVAEVADRLGLSPTIAYIDGDDLLPRIIELAESGALQPFAGGELGDPSRFLTANAYLGCFGIVDALTKGADIVITGRVTDAAVTCGPAAWHHGWQRTDFDQLAGGVVAGHIIECSAQATGGNYSFFHEIEGRNEVGGRARFGFPWAEVAADGSCVIGKHEGTGGVVNVETVTSQLLYEIGGPEYLGPDVTARFDTIEVEQVDRDRVRVFGVEGQAPPATLKVAMNELGGFRNSFTVALTGLDIDEKAAFARGDVLGCLSLRPRRLRLDREQGHPHEQARSGDPGGGDRALAGDGEGSRRTQGRPGVRRRHGAHRVGRHPRHVRPQRRTRCRITVRRVPTGDGPERPRPPVRPRRTAPPPRSIRLRRPVDRIDVDRRRTGAGSRRANSSRFRSARSSVTRSGDKGGDANLGVYARGDAGWAWLDHELTVDRLRELLPETADMTIDRYRYPNLRALNFVIRGLLQEGVAASTRQDAQAKAVGEWLRARVVSVPHAVLD